ncbi:MAG: hypothetical protein Q9186_007059 [Xanthomendoza sp. 1 TL-2023]
MAPGENHFLLQIKGTLLAPSGARHSRKAGTEILLAANSRRWAITAPKSEDISLPRKAVIFLTFSPIMLLTTHDSEPRRKNLLIPPKIARRKFSPVGDNGTKVGRYLLTQKSCNLLTILAYHAADGSPGNDMAQICGRLATLAKAADVLA